jgi:hypothetical protein
MRGARREILGKSAPLLCHLLEHPVVVLVEHGPRLGSYYRVSAERQFITLLLLTRDAPVRRACDRCADDLVDHMNRQLSPLER